MDYLLHALGTPALLEYVVTIFVTLISIGLTRWLGIKVSQKAQDDLHKALLTGVEAALARGITGKRAIAQAIDHAERSTPDAIKRLQPAIAVLENIAAAKLGEVALAHAQGQPVKKPLAGSDGGADLGAGAGLPPMPPKR